MFALPLFFFVHLTSGAAHIPHTVPDTWYIQNRPPIFHVLQRFYYTTQKSQAFLRLSSVRCIRARFTLVRGYTFFVQQQWAGATHRLVSPRLQQACHSSTHSQHGPSRTLKKARCRLISLPQVHDDRCLAKTKQKASRTPITRYNRITLVHPLFVPSDLQKIKHRRHTKKGSYRSVRKRKERLTFTLRSKRSLHLRAVL